MKKLLLFISITLISVATVNAQCVPDASYTTPGVYPDSATGFANACVGQPYEQVVTNIVPVDTVVEIIPGVPTTLIFDSVVITSFTGLPPGFTYACNSPQNTVSSANSCTFEGNTTGCIAITGTPSAADIGVYNLVITLDVYMSGGLTPLSTQTVDYYSIEVLDCTAGISQNSLSSIVAYPNPTDNILTVSGLENANNIVITDASGKIILSSTGVMNSSIEFNVADLETGIYFVKVSQNNLTETIRFVKK